MNNFFTIGYEASTINEFVATLKSAGVETLADVREVSVSRKKGFSKNKLREILAQEGIAYAHFRQLGDPKAGREAARRGDYKLFRLIYNNHLNQPASLEALHELVETVRNNLTCLMCYERDPKECHRTIIANQLEVYNLRKFDLFVDRRMRYEQFPEKLPSHSYREGFAATQ